MGTETDQGSGDRAFRLVVLVSHPLPGNTTQPSPGERVQHFRCGLTLLPGSNTHPLNRGFSELGRGNPHIGRGALDLSQRWRNRLYRPWGSRGSFLWNLDVGQLHQKFVNRRRSLFDRDPFAFHHGWDVCKPPFLGFADYV